MSIVFLWVVVLSILYMLLSTTYFIGILLILYIGIPLYYGVRFFVYYTKNSRAFFLHIGITSICISLLFISVLLSSLSGQHLMIHPTLLLHIQLTVLLILALNLLFAPDLIHSSLSRSIVFSSIVVLITVYAMGTFHDASNILIIPQNTSLSKNYMVSIEVIALLFLFSLFRIHFYRGAMKSDSKTKTTFITILLLLALGIVFFLQNNILQLYPIQFILIFVALFCFYHCLSHADVNMTFAEDIVSLDENDKRILTFFENIPLGFGLFQCKLDEDKKVTSVTILKINNAAVSIFNQAKDFIENNDLNTVLPSIDHLLIEKCDDIFCNSIAKTFRFIHPTSQRAYQIQIYPMDKEVLGAIFTNITREYTLEKEYFDFISTTSHELRTPIVAIRESFHLLMNSWNTEKTQPQLHLQNICSRNITKIRNLVEQVLDYQKFTQQDGKDKSLEQINDIVQEVYFTLLPVALSNNLQLTFIPDKKLPMILVSKEGIETVVTNLINNAIKYSEKGTIKVITTFQDHHVIIQVTDQGIGMSEKDMETIFEPFKRVRAKNVKSINGSGLGLSITKKIILEHQGYILVESRPMEGSTFTVHLPQA